MAYDGQGTDWYAGEHDEAVPMPVPSVRGRTWFAVLGPLEVYRDGASLDLGPYKQRVLLAVLLFRPNAVVTVDELMDAVWAGEPPRTARKNLQLYVSALRKILGTRLHHAGYGYAIDVEQGEMDLLRFAGLAAAGRRAVLTGDPDSGRALLHEALGLWRDRPAVDLAGVSSIAEESNAFMEQYIAAYEDWADLELVAGHQLAVVEKLGALARQHPFRERLTMSLMTALSLAGDRRAALAHYERHRQLMARELGLAPSPVLQRHYRNILAEGMAGTTLPAAANAPLRAGSPAKPAQLPPNLPDFVGRQDQVARLVETLGRGGAEPEVAVISGHTGAGKTALAVHAAHHLAHQYPDGQVFIAMRDNAGAPRPWREVMADLLRDTGSDARLPEDEAAAVGLWRSWIADRSFLIVLDDAVDEASTRRLLPGRGANATIVTSCRTLGGLDATCRIELGEFSHAEALALLGRALGEHRIRGAEPAVRQIIARCGGQPLVIRVVAAKLTVLRHLSVGDYADRLDSVGDVLEELTIGDRSVRARLHRLYAGLPPSQQAAFRALGRLSARAADQNDVLAVLRGLPGLPEHALEGLIDANLIAAMPGHLPEAEFESEAELEARIGSGSAAAGVGMGVAAVHSIRYEMPTTAYLYATALQAGDLQTLRASETPLERVN